VRTRAAVTPVRRLTDAGLDGDQDLVAVEAPLGVTVSRAGDAHTHSLGVLMRTPGDDLELVSGFLYGEGAIRHRADIVDLSLVRGAKASEADAAHVTLKSDVGTAFERLGRAAATTSACGHCGRLQVLAVDEGRACPIGQPRLECSFLVSLPERLRRRQRVFDETGGLHAAGLVTLDGGRETVREDVGRHNAVDKVIGAALDHGWLPGHGLVLVVSGRVAYEIVQKAVMAGLPAVVAIGAPSTLAVEAARLTGLTLVGFVRESRFTVYSGWDRITGPHRGIPPT